MKKIALSLLSIIFLNNVMYADLPEEEIPGGLELLNDAVTCGQTGGGCEALQARAQKLLKQGIQENHWPYNIIGEMRRKIAYDYIIKLAEGNVKEVCDELYHKVKEEEKHANEEAYHQFYRVFKSH